MKKLLIVLLALLSFSSYAGFTITENNSNRISLTHMSGIDMFFFKRDF